jgi:chaperonin GroES
MSIDVTSIKSLLGDRILIRPLARPEKRGRLMLPAATAKEKAAQSDIWWGVVEALGRDARYPDAYKIAVGDVVGCSAIGRQCETITGADREEHVWVAEEFIAAKDAGRVMAWREGRKRGPDVGIVPVGPYVLVRPDEEEDTRNGVHLPMSSREAQKMGESLAVSEGDCATGELVPLHVEAGSRILFGRYSGSWVKIDEELLLMKQEDIIGVMEPERAQAKSKETAYVG